MTRHVKVIILAVVMIMMISTLAACNAPEILYGTEYNQVFYDSEDQRFKPTGNSIIIGDESGENFKYQEKYLMGNNVVETYSGTYVRDDAIDLLFMVLNQSSFKDFKNKYKKQLSNMGYTRSEIDNIIMPNVVDRGEMFRYKDYMFKTSAIIAAKVMTDDHALTDLDGRYTFKGLLNERRSEMKVERNTIYLRGTDETGEPIYTQQIGVCELNGDIITIEPQVALEEGNKVNDAMKYLIADIVFPRKFAEDLDDEGMYKPNDIIKYYENVRVRVIVSNFYTLKDTK